MATSVMQTNIENLAQSKLGPTLIWPLFRRWKDLYVAHGGTLPKDDRILNDKVLIAAQMKSGLTLNEIAKRGIQWVASSEIMPQVTAVESMGNVVGQGAGVLGNWLGGTMNRMGPPMSGAVPAVSSRPYPYTP